MLQHSTQGHHSGVQDADVRLYSASVAALPDPLAQGRVVVSQPRALIGIAALGVALVCVFGSLATLTFSDGKAVADWPIQPTVYLAAITAIANSAIAFAHLEAVQVWTLLFVPFLNSPC